jgi:hypothetical protein
MGIECLSCGRFFKSDMTTVRIIGPDVKVTCPFCSYEYKGKLNRFVDTQVGGYIPQSVNCAAKMIAKAQYIELNSSEYYKERGLRHGKRKKVSNI